jgi:hypothetical protein
LRLQKLSGGIRRDHSEHPLAERSRYILVIKQAMGMATNHGSTMLSKILIMQQAPIQ